MAGGDRRPSLPETAQRLAGALEDRGQDYAFGGAIALAYWTEPRGTVDVDITLYVSPDKPSECVRLLHELGCELVASETLASLREHGFCRVQYDHRRLDVFLPTIPFYEVARGRRKRVLLGDREVFVWDAESLIVFKMMFFRRKDVADVEQILRSQGADLARDWVEQHLLDIFGARDLRIAQWAELVQECDNQA